MSTLNQATFLKDLGDIEQALYILMSHEYDVVEPINIIVQFQFKITETLEIHLVFKLVSAVRIEPEVRKAECVNFVLADFNVILK